MPRASDLSPSCRNRFGSMSASPRFATQSSITSGSCHCLLGNFISVRPLKRDQATTVARARHGSVRLASSIRGPGKPILVDFDPPTRPIRNAHPAILDLECRREKPFLPRVIVEALDRELDIGTGVGKCPHEMEG